MPPLAWLLVLALSADGGAAKPALPDPDALEEMPVPDTEIWRFFSARKLECSSSTERLSHPLEWKLSGLEFLFDGARLYQKQPSGEGLTLGVLGAVKDFVPETRQALDFFLDTFRQEKIDLLVLGGDIASSEYDAVQVLAYCAQAGWPVLAISGNTESRSAFNRALLLVQKAHPQVVNSNLVQRLDIDGYTLLTLGGYYERRFVHETAACIYRAEQLDRLAQLAEGSPARRLLITHGPPRGRGKRAMDFASEGGNVGDTALNKFIERAGIKFGIFSHILEAGGTSDDGQGKAVAEGTWAGKLYINVGSANPLAWPLNDGRISCGMAAVFRLKGDRASYRLLRHACR